MGDFALLNWAKAEALKETEAPADETGPSDTRRAGLLEIAPHVKGLQLDVLTFLVSRGSRGATDFEIAEHFDGLKNTYAARRNELTKKGLVVDSGRRRPTGHGKGKAAVWVVKHG